MAVIGRWPDYTPHYTPYKVSVIERWLDYTPHKVGVLESGVKKGHCNCGGGGGGGHFSMHVTGLIKKGSKLLSG